MIIFASHRSLLYHTPNSSKLWRTLKNSGNMVQRRTFTGSVASHLLSHLLSHFLSHSFSPSKPWNCYIGSAIRSSSSPSSASPTQNVCRKGRGWEARESQWTAYGQEIAAALVVVEEVVVLRVVEAGVDGCQELLHLLHVHDQDVHVAGFLLDIKRMRWSLRSGDKITSTF